LVRFLGFDNRGVRVDARGRRVDVRIAVNVFDRLTFVLTKPVLTFAGWAPQPAINKTPELKTLKIIFAFLKISFFN
jgi:hypothetical protein